jgi:hypothetical protein
MGILGGYLSNLRAAQMREYQVIYLCPRREFGSSIPVITICKRAMYSMPVRPKIRASQAWTSRMADHDMNIAAAVVSLAILCLALLLGVKQKQ